MVYKYQKLPCFAYIITWPLFETNLPLICVPYDNIKDGGKLEVNLILMQFCIIRI